MSPDIIKKLKTLKSIAPRAEWKKSNRQLLMMAIKGGVEGDATPATPATWTQGLAKVFFSWKVFRLALRPVLTLVAILGLVLGSGLSVSASQIALPGDTLYSLKLAAEKVQVALTFKKEEQAKMHVELAGKRINEVKKIKANPLPPQNKNQKINVAIDKFQQEIATAQTKLENLNNKELPEAAVLEVAKVVNERTDEYQEILAATTADPEVSGEVAEKITQGLTMVKELSEQAKQIVEIAMANESNSEGTTEPETSEECVENCNVNAEQNTNTEGTDETNVDSSDGIKNTANTNLIPVPQKVYIKPVVPVNTNTPPEPEVIDESKLRVGIDLRQDPIE
jgi:hypothetical protein